MLSLIDN